MDKRGWVMMCWALLGCSQASSSLPKRSLAPFVATPADPAAKAKIRALAPQLDMFLQKKFSASGATGMVAGIVLEGELVYEHHFGVVARGSSAAVNGDSLFRIASLSKSFAALAVLQLRDAGMLSLDRPITEYLPELGALRGASADAAALTTRQLLTHTAGFSWDDLWGSVSFGYSASDLDGLLQRGVELAHEPGSAFEYSNLGYALLGRLITRVSAMSFADYVTQNILLPLGMTSSVWSGTAVPAELLAMGYWGEREPLSDALRLTDGAFQPAGGMYTSLHDYARYLAFQLSAYPPRDSPEQGPVRRSTLREAHTAQRRVGAQEQPLARRTLDGIELQDSSYGFGWFNETSCNYRERVEHGGWEPGYVAGVIMLPLQRVAVVTLATTQPVRSAEGILKLLRDADALPAPLEPTPSPALVAAQQRVTALLNHWDAALAEQAFDPGSAHYPWYGLVHDAFPKLARVHGHCEPNGPLHTISRLRGAWAMSCERGSLELKIELTPTDQPRIVLLRWTDELPPDQRMIGHATQLAAAIGGDTNLIDQLLAMTVDRERIRKLFAHAAIDHGTCTVERSIAGDGHLKATFALSCLSERLDLSLELEQSSGLISALELHLPHAAGAACWQ